MNVKLKNIYVCFYLICNQIGNDFLKIYDGGSDKDSQLNVFTGNTLPSTTLSSGNQMFISYKKSGDGAPGKEFSASFAFGKKVNFFSFF